MQFGVFTVGDVTTDPTTGRTPTEAERIQAMVTIAEKAARTTRLLLSRATTLITTNDPLKLAEDYATRRSTATARRSRSSWRRRR